MARKVDVEAALAEFGIPPNAASDNVVLFPASKKSATDAELTRFELFARNGFGPLLLPAGHPGWMVAPESTIKPDDVAKVPMYLGADGLARGYGGWTTRTPATEQDIQRWQRMGCLDRPANVSLRTGEVAGASLACGATDIDVDCPVLAPKIVALAKECLGVSPRRMRPNSPRALMLYRLAPDAANLSKIRQEFTGKDGGKHAVEILLRGQQCIVAGRHKSGAEYEWPDGYPVTGDLPEIDAADIERFLNALSGDAEGHGGLLQREGCTLTGKSARLAGHSQKRQPIGHVPFLAPSDDAIRKALECFPNTHENVPTHNDFVQFTAAIKAACGGSEDCYADFEPWALEYPENTPEYVRKTWASIRDAAVGWDWLCKRTRYGYDRFDGGAATASRFEDESKETGERSKPADTATSAEGAPSPTTKKQPFIITAKPFVLRDAAQTKPRRWLYGKHYIRKFLSTTAAPGGLGKSSLTLVEAVAMATGKDLLGVLPTRGKQFRVLYWNGEDPLDEIERRVIAICQQYKITMDDLGGRLFLLSGRDTPLCVAQAERNGFEIVTQVIEGLERFILENQIDIAIFDPLIALHKVPENDNTANKAVCDQLASIADKANCSIELVDHMRKGASGERGERTADDLRGAGAKVDAYRVVRVLNRMTKEDALKAGVENHRRYFRADDEAKGNLAPPAARATWYHLASVNLDNGDEDNDADDVGVVTPWEWPDASKNLSHDNIRTIQKAIAAGKWREHVLADAWAGHAVAQALGWNKDDKATKEKARGVLKS